LATAVAVCLGLQISVLIFPSACYHLTSLLFKVSLDKLSAGTSTM